MWRVTVFDEVRYWSITYYNIIGISNLYGDVKPDDETALINGLKLFEADAQEFSSASDGTVYGYLCKASNVQISGYVIDTFYFYLVPDSEYKRKISLLGADFIACCKFRHNINKDIIIDKFDSNSYIENFSKVKCFDIDELSHKGSIIPSGKSGESFQDLSSAFYNFILSNK